MTSGTRYVNSRTVNHPSVANVSFSTAWGGLEMSSVKMTRLFAQAGYPSFEICQPETPIHKALLDQGLEARPVKTRNYMAPSATWFIRQQIRERQLGALFMHSMKDIWLVSPALIGLPDVKLFGFARMFLRGINKKDFLHSRLYGRLNKMIALSHAQKELLLDCLPVPEEKYVVIPNGVDVERFKPRPRREDIRASWGVQSDHFLFGLIGRLDRQKGSLEFVEAAAKVIQQFPHTRFVMVGGNTLGEEEFDRAIKLRLQELRLQEAVILTDFRKDIPDVMNALDAFVMPSYEENFANVMLEALASGLPCVGTRSGGTPEILSFGEAGLLCAPKSSDSLAQSLSQLLSAPALVERLKAQSRMKAVQEYDMRVVFNRIENLVTEK